jgi:D-3-phosphoglycerate dehydrogenase / 2-oxoglutarate reductase
MKVIVTDEISPNGLQLLSEDPRVELDIHLGLSEEELHQKIGDYDAIITRSGTRVDAPLLDCGKRLKVVARAGVGIDNVDVHYASSKGIIVVNAPFGNTNSAAEHTMAIMLAACRKIVEANGCLKAGEWKRGPFTGSELKGRTLGIIGLGKVGGRVALRSKAFEMDVIACDPYIAKKRGDDLGVRLVSLDELISTSDIISVHTPLNDETRGMIGDLQFEKMREGVFIVNCARGGIIDEEAMLATLESGKVRGAAFDVWSSEPPNTDCLRNLIAHPHMLVTPHLGANTFEAQKNVAVDVSREIINYIDGRPFENAVNVPKFDPDLMEQMKPFLNLAERLGRFISQLAPSNPNKITFSYNGKIAEHDCEPLTVCGLASFLARQSEEEVNMVNARMIAEDAGIAVEEVRSTESVSFSNLITITLDAPDSKRTIAGTLFEGIPRIVKMRDFQTDFQPEGHMLVMSYEDRPGMLGKIGTVLGEVNVNIAAMVLGRREKAGEAMVVFSVDSPVDEATMEKLGKVVEARYVKAVDMNGAA